MAAITNDPMERGLYMVDCEDEPLLCDFCDEEKPLAHINTISRDVFCVCKDCLQVWINELK